MPQQITAIVPRIEGIGWPKVAVVEATLSDEAIEGKDLTPPEVLCGSITSAVTDWIRETDQGKELWKRSSNDLNVGDLAAHLPDPTIQPYFERYGIVEGPIIRTFSSEDTSCWTYDTVLVDDPELQDMED